MAAEHTAEHTADVRVLALMIRALLACYRLTSIRSELAGLHLFHRLHRGVQLLSGH